jgi:hypothetical protein
MEARVLAIHARAIRVVYAAMKPSLGVQKYARLSQTGQPDHGYIRAMWANGVAHERIRVADLDFE